MDAPLYEPVIASVWKDLAATFRSGMRWVIVLLWIEGVLCAVAAVWAAIEFFDATAVRDWILYAAIFVSALVLLMAIKIWYWGFANRLAIQAEIRRLRSDSA